MFKTAAGRAVPQRAASEETRRQILDTALALFRERGGGFVQPAGRAVMVAAPGTFEMS